MINHFEGYEKLTANRISLAYANQHGLSIYFNKIVGDSVLYIRSRDSGNLVDSNFEYMGDFFDKIDNSQVYGMFKGCAIVGWNEFLVISKDAPEFVKAHAEDMLQSMACGGVLDEEDYSQRQLDAAQDYWKGMGLDERVKLCQKTGTTPFTARHEELPAEHYEIFDELLQKVS